MRQCGSLSCIGTLFLGGVLAWAILLIHSILLEERKHIDKIESEILSQQKKWNEIWQQSRIEDAERFAATNQRQPQVEIQSSLPDLPQNEAQVQEETVKAALQVENILRDNLAVNPNEGLAPDYKDKSMEGFNDNMQIESAGNVASPMVVDHNPMVEARKIKRLSMPSEKRMPKFIIMGVKKCGTSALSRYLKIHPDLAAGGETYFFANSYKNGLDYYKSLMPNSTEDMLTFEKTPNYYRLPVVPDRIRNFNRTIKLIYVTCDPVRRTLSDFFHIHRYDKVPPKEGDFEDALLERFSGMEAEFKEIRDNNPENWFDDVYRMYKDRTNWFNYTDGKSNLIINGAYSIYYRRWLENFDPSQILMVDGTDMINDPAKWTIRVQEFVGIETLIDDRNFVYDKERGFYCFMRQGDHTKYCLRNGKGRTSSKTMSEEFRVRLFNFFEPFSIKFAESLKVPMFDWNWNPNVPEQPAEIAAVKIPVAKIAPEAAVVAVAPAEPVAPAEAVASAVAVAPAEAVTPAEAVAPAEPVALAEPVAPAEPVAQGSPMPENQAANQPAA